MKQEFDFEAFAKALKTKRVIQLKTGLREVSQALKDVSRATISRMERGKAAHIDHIIKCCNWLGRPISDFVIEKKGKK